MIHSRMVAMAVVRNAEFEGLAKEDLLVGSGVRSTEKSRMTSRV